MKNLPEFHAPHSLSASLSSSTSSSSSSSSLLNLHPPDVGAEEWELADRRVHEILSVIQPTVISECRRKEIIEYIQILIGASYGIKVFPFGSVPLKTYIPNGDIDLTALCHCDEDILSSTFCCLLQNEEMMNTKIKVRDVQWVPAQVKVVKCYVEGISVDISFNQMAGLCALSFLEQVDQLIGKDHLFKRSVILIKTWCFYESRMHGAHNGLISTYSLETMVAHIINSFHSSLHSPLGVLHKFLGYYSKFDWESHCVAIDGLMLISSLPEVVVQTPDESDGMLFSAEFLQNCRRAYSLSTGIHQTGGSSLYVKFMNVIDPLRYDNNLGRSVSKASLNRMKFALSYANEKLTTIFALPLEEIAEGIDKFFKTTLGRHGSVPLPELVTGRSELSGKPNGSKDLLAGIEYGLWSHNFGVFQGCKDPMLWKKWNKLGLAGRYDPHVLFQMNENEMTKSRGTGTYIPQVPRLIGKVYRERTPNRRRSFSPRIFNKPLADDVCTEGTDSLCSEEDEAKSCVDTSLPELPPLPETNPVEMNTITENFETVFDSPPLADLPINMTEADEDNKSPENEEKTISVNNPTPPVLGDAIEFPDLRGLRLGDASELDGNRRKVDSGCK